MAAKNNVLLHNDSGGNAYFLIVLLLVYVFTTPLNIVYLVLFNIYQICQNANLI